MNVQSPSVEELKQAILRSRLKRRIDHHVAAVGESTFPIADRNAPLPLSWAQQRLWFLSQLDQAAGAAYHMPVALRLSGALNRGALQATLDRIVARHENLRTTFVSESGVPVQKIAPADRGFEWVDHDLRSLDASAQDAAVKQLGVSEARAPFDLAAGPLIRGRLLCLAEQEHVLFFTQHHIVSDGWSIGLLIKEVSALYAAFCLGLPDPLPSLAIQYADYAAWQRQWLQGAALQSQIDFWRRHLSGAPALLELPADRARPPMQSYIGDRIDLRLTAELSDGLRRLSQRHGNTLFMTLLAAWAALLSRLSGQSEVVVGSPVANRRRSEIEPLLGFFVNTLALRIEPRAEATVSELLAQVKATTLDAYAHQDVPFEQVVEALQPARALSYSPVFQTMFAFNNTPGGGELSLPGLRLTRMGSARHTAHFDLELALRETGECIEGNIGFASDLFDRTTIQRFVGYFVTMLKSMVADDAQCIGRLPLLSADDRTQLLADFNDTRREYPVGRAIHVRVEEQVRRRPEAVAAIFESQSLSYAELNRRANQLAHRLIALGAKPDDRVAICVERGLDLVIGVLAILKAGAAYVPLDPAYPADRLAYMLENSAPVALLSHHAMHTDALLSTPVPLLLLDDASLSAQPEHNPDVAGLVPAHLAYVIYTSGSTGQPKGVAMPQGPLLNLLDWQCAIEAPYAGGEKVLQFSALGFDVAFQEIFYTLCSGGSLVLLREAIRQDPFTLVGFIKSAGIERIFLPFVAFQGLVAAAERLGEALPSLKNVVTAGEQLFVTAAIRSFFARLPGRRLHNHYGPTETHVVTAHTLDGDPARWPATPPIGVPISNTQIYILDAELQPVPLGVTGELYIGGAGVARGYLHRDDLTAKRFLADPFSDTPGARMYKTGDLARWLGDGSIDYLGRNDFQVKIRGFRIELGEIEAKLSTCIGVREAVVMARDDSVGGKRLVAYVLPQEGTELSASTLRAALALDLAEYMIPSAFVSITAWPLTPNGKLDRKALPAPDQSAVATRAYEAPEGGIETVVATVWQQLLDLERVGRNDHFFELGGHSLLAVQLVTRLRDALGAELALRDIFAQPTLQAMARVLADADRQVHEAIPLADRTAALPASWSQQRLWFLDQLDHAAGAAYHMPAALRLIGALDRAALQATLDRIVARHESLRTRFAAADGAPVQVIAPPDCGFQLTAHDLSAVDAGARDAIVAELGLSEARAPFDLATGPLIRGRLLRIAEHEYVLLVTQHHIITDGWSLGLLVKEVSTLYAAFSQGRPDPLPALAIQYPDYAVWQRQWLQGATLQAQIDFWRERLSSAPALLELPTDRPRPQLQSHAGDRLKLRLSPTLTAALRKLSQRHGVTLFMSLLAGWASLLSRLSGQDDIVIGSPVANRGRAEIEPLIGFFVNTLALRIDLCGNPTVAELLAQVKAMTLSDYAHQDVPFEQVVEALQPERSLSYSPVFQTMLAFDNTTTGVGGLKLHGLELQPMGSARHTVHFDLELGVVDTGAMLEGNFSYASDLFDRSTVERFSGYFVALLEGMVADDAHRIAQLPLLSAQEHDRLLFDLNATDRHYVSAHSVHALFEQQVFRDPDAIALTFEATSLSYSELNRRANQVAHHLIGLGLRPDDRVALCVERSPEMVIGLLGILKAGGAYVPLDPAYPPERLSYMLADSAPAAVLTVSLLRARLPLLGSVGKPVLDLDADLFSSQPDRNPEVAELTSSHLAYVIYTSGSTGQPKGVMVEHRNVLNHIRVHADHCCMRAGDRLLQFASYSFDTSVEEIFPALSVGATIVLRPAGMIAPDELFVDFLHEQRIDIVDLPTAFWHQWAQQVGAGRCLPDARVRLIIVGGEKLEQRYLAAWLSNPKARACTILNTYGPTEATVYATAIAFDSASPLPAHEVPIGRPVANTQVYLLDEYLQPVPTGVTGEIHIGGTQVARGYLNRDDLTAQRFVPDPFACEAGARMYKTGDLGRWLGDGTIAYLGRNDFQVKIRGFRIELGEIEAKLSACAGVREAVVLAREDVAGDKRLVAYVVAEEGVELATAQLRSALLQILAEHMVPSAFVRLAALPLTPNGKLDRKALPAPDQGAVVSRAYAAPIGSTETRLAEVWQELLGLQRIGRNDHFFELGGHSLLAIKLIHQIKARLGVSLPLASVFSTPTIAALAELASTGPQHKSLIVPLQNRSQGRPLFCIHPIGGQVSFYHALAGQSVDLYPVYGVQSPEVIGLALQLDTVEEMAEAYAAAIRTVQPTGPYRLLGWSSGGIFAAAIAKHLTELGIGVEYLGLVDAYLMSEHAGIDEDRLTIEALRAEMRSRGLSPARRSPAATSFEHISVGDVLAMDFAHAAIYLSSLGWTDFDVETFEHLKEQIPITRQHLKLLSRFAPAKVDVPLQVFWAGEPLDEETIGPCDYGQTSLIAEPMAGATHWVGADHYGMLAEPHVRRIAAAIAAFLNEKTLLPRASIGSGKIIHPVAETIA